MSLKAEQDKEQGLAGGYHMDLNPDYYLVVLGKTAYSQVSL